MPRTPSYLNSTLVTTEGRNGDSNDGAQMYLNSTLVTTEALPAVLRSGGLTHLNSTLVTTEAGSRLIGEPMQMRFKFYFSNN